MFEANTNTMHLGHSSDYSSVPLALLAYGSVCFAILTVLYMYLKSQYLFKSSTSALPGIRSPFYSIYGVMRYSPSQSTMKKLSLPKTAPIPYILGGLSVLFREEYATAVRIGLQNVIVLHNAESVEDFYCSNVDTTKPFREVMLPFFGNGLFLSWGEKWRSRRKFLTPLFRYDVLKDFIPIFDEKSKILVDILRSKENEPWVDVQHHISLCAMDIVCKTFLAVDFGSQKENCSKFITAMERVLETMVERVVSPLYLFEVYFAMFSLGRQFGEDIRYIRASVMEAIHQRKKKMRLTRGGQTDVRRFNTSLIDMCLKEQEFLELSEEGLRDEIISFIFGGQDTTSCAISWALYLIGLHPEIQTKIHEELDGIFGDDSDREITAEDLKEMCYLDCVLKESQRLYPSVPFFPRKLLEDCTLSRIKMKKGTIVLLDAYNLHRNADVFPNPEVFNPDRFLHENSARRSSYAYIPFSAGAKSCIGRLYAVMESKTMIANILLKFSLKSLEPRDKIHVLFAVTLKSHTPLKVKFIPRNTNYIKQ